MKVTATVSTRNRYESTLPVCLMSIATQKRPPDELIVYDDGEHRDLRKDPLYLGIFHLLDIKGIDWKINFGEGKGQVKNHQRALSDAKHELIWRFDDDHYHEPNVLSTLLDIMEKNTMLGAVGCSIFDPKANPKPNKLASSKIGDIYLGMNEQWYPFEDGVPSIKEVDHLYSSFLFRKNAAKDGYDMTLSRVGHREETIFTYQMKMNGWKLMITGECITWHFNDPKGGIRDNTKEEMWKHDEQIFSGYMNKWGVRKSDVIPFILDNGLGDHYMFKTILPSLLLHYASKKTILACCYPEVFKGFEIPIISIAQARTMFDCSRYDVYKWMIDHNWKGTVIDAYRKLYL